MVRRTAIALVCVLGGACAATAAACASDYTADDGGPDAASGSDGATADASTNAGCFALDFAGLGAVDVPASPELDLAPPFTIEAWVRPGGSAPEQHLVSHHDHDGSKGYLFMLIGPAGEAGGASLRVYGDAGEAGPNIYSVGFGAGSQPPSAAWSHVAVTMTSVLLRVFVDGVMKDSNAGVPSGFPSAFPGGALRMGRAADLAGQFAFYGALDEVRISKAVRYPNAAFAVPAAPHAVDQDTVALWHFDEGSGTVVRDATGRHDGVMSGARWLPVSCAAR